MRVADFMLNTDFSIDGLLSYSRKLKVLPGNDFRQRSLCVVVQGM